MNFDPERELELARRAVMAAARVTDAVQRDLVKADTLEKRDKSPVTVADFASQAVVCAKLLADSAVPFLVGEENAADLRGDEPRELRAKVHAHAASILGADAPDEAATLAHIDRGAHDPADGATYWTLDPIDGTKGFLRGEQYAIALALIHEGEVVLGALGCPRLPLGDAEGVLMSAAKGLGATQEPLFGDEPGARVSISVSDIDSPSAARFCESVESGHSDQGQSASIASALGITAEPVRMDSQAKYATLARGDASIYLRLPTRKDYQEKIWDHAAGVIVICEAGGRVTDVRGEALDFGQGPTLRANKGVIATNGPIHDAVVAAVRGVLEA